jgi:hypothetical protein
VPLIYISTRKDRIRTIFVSLAEIEDKNYYLLQAERPYLKPIFAEGKNKKGKGLMLDSSQFSAAFH